MAPHKKTSKRLGNAPSTASVDDVLGTVAGKIDASLAQETREIPLSSPEYGYAAKAEKKPCAWPFKKPFNPRVEMEIVTGKKADKLGVPAGPALRFCFAKNTAGPLIPVKTVGKAVEIGDRYLKCLKTEKGAKQCALDSAEGQPYKIAGSPRRRSRR